MIFTSEFSIDLKEVAKYKDDHFEDNALRNHLQTMGIDIGKYITFNDSIFQGWKYNTARMLLIDYGMYLRARNDVMTGKITVKDFLEILETK